MTGNDELASTPEGLNTLRLRQSSDIFANDSGGAEIGVPVRGETAGCKHGGPKSRASNDRKGEREYLGLGGEKRRPSTGGSAKGIPEGERGEEEVGSK